MNDDRDTITQDTFHRELARAQTEQARLRGSIRLLLAFNVLLLAVCVTLAAGMWRLGGQVLDTTAEVNGLRATIQAMFADNLPQVQELQAALERANAEATDINESMAEGGRFTDQVDGAIERVNKELPETMTTFFRQQGPALMKETLESPDVTTTGSEQVKAMMIQALDDPAVEQKMLTKMGDAMDQVVRGMGLDGPAKGGKE